MIVVVVKAEEKKQNATLIGWPIYNAIFSGCGGGAGI